MPQDTLKRLQSLKSKIPEYKEQRDNFKGQLHNVMENIKEACSASTIEEAEKIKEDMDDKIRKMDRALDNGLEDLEEKYQWQ